MKLVTRLYLYAAVVATLLPVCVSAQPLDSRRKVDTLSIKDRLSIRTNGTDWALMIPNVGVEFDIFNTNYNRWAVNLNFRYRPGTKSKYVAPVVYNCSEIKVEGRMYWRERQAQANGAVGFHIMPWHKLMSCRRMIPKHPNTVFYRGVYASYGTYGMRLTGTGHEGTAAQVGITWGFVKPLYAFANGNSIDMEIGISGGVAYAKDDHLEPEIRDNEFVKTPGEWKFVKCPIINDLHAALVYRIGKYPIQKKYRWRYDVDMAYRAKIDSIWLVREKYMTEMSYQDSVYQVVAKEFKETYDSVILERRLDKQEMLNRTAPDRDDSLKIRAKAEKRSITRSKRLAREAEQDAVRAEKERTAKKEKAAKEEYAAQKKKEKAERERLAEVEAANKEQIKADEEAAKERQKEREAALKAKQKEIDAAKKTRKAEAAAAAKAAQADFEAEEKAAKQQRAEKLAADKKAKAEQAAEEKKQAAEKAALQKQEDAAAAAAKKEKAAAAAAAKKEKDAAADAAKKQKAEAAAAEKKAQAEAAAAEKAKKAEAAAAEKKAKAEAAAAEKAKKAEQAAAEKAKKAEEAAKAKAEKEAQKAEKNSK